MDKQNFNSDEAARFLCVSKSKLMKMCCYRQIRYSKVGRLNIFTKEDLLEYLERNKIVTREDLQQEVEKQLITLKSK